MRKWICMLTAGILSVFGIGSLSVQAQGYGQGVQYDTSNRPLGAIDFNAQFGNYDAYALSNDPRYLILTFDQGYENGYTTPILDTLKEKNVSAIFFLTGDYAKKEPELVKRMIAEGHMLGNHGMTHADMDTLSAAQLKEEILSLHDYVKQTYDYDMQYLRPPCGEYSDTMLSVTQELGYKTVFWSFAYVDWLTDSQPDPAAAFERMTAAAHGGGIYLLHSVSQTNSEILGDVIDALREGGYLL